MLTRKGVENILTKILTNLELTEENEGLILALKDDALEKSTLLGEDYESEDEEYEYKEKLEDVINYKDKYDELHAKYIARFMGATSEDELNDIHHEEEKEEIALMSENSDIVADIEKMSYEDLFNKGDE